MKNTFVKVLSFVMALMMVVGTFGTLAVFAADHEHTKGTLVEKKDPTCQKSGYSVYVCGVEGCGEEWTTDLVLANAKYHNYEDKAAEDATCTSNAKPAAKVCSHCGKTPDGKDRPEIPGTQLKHNFVGKIVEATCSTNKMLVHTCSLCGKTAKELKVEGLDKDLGGAQNLGHKNPDLLTWTVVTAPSQTATECLPGVAQCTCKKCGEVVDTVEIPADHTWVDLNPDNLPCIEWDKGVIACKVCDKLHPNNANAEKRKTSGHGIKLVIGTDADEINDLTAADYDYTVDAKNPPKKYNEDGELVSMTIAELAKHNFANGSKLHKKAKCTEKGSALVQCSCGEVYVKDIEASTHNWGAWEYNTEIKLCTDAVTKTRKCADCKAKDSVVLKAAAATAHNYVVDANKSKTADCDDIGYTVKVCQNKTLLGVVCGHSIEEGHKDALGHTWGTATFKSGDSCTAANAKYEHKCSVCNAVEETSKPASVTACKWGSEVVVKATCMEKEYKYTPCTVCGAWKDNADKSHDYAADAKVDENNHVYATEAQMKAFVNATTWTEGTNGIIGYAAGTTSTCTSAGKLTVKCTNAACAQKNTIITVDAPLKDHDIRTGLSKIEYKDGKLVVNDTTTTDIPTSCTAAGAKADGKACKNCTYVEKRPTVIALDPTAHKYSEADLVFEAGATCLTPGYKQYNASCTHGIITVITDDGKLADHKYTKNTEAGEVDNWIDFKAAKCLEDGNHKYIGCIWCKEIKPGADSMKTDISDCGCGMTGDDAAAVAAKHADMATSGNYVIPATNHDYAEVKEVRETCTASGVKAHLDCKNCNFKKLGNTEYDYGTEAGKKAFDLAAAIAAHYGQYTTKFDKKDPTCTEKGISAESAAKSWCTVCQEDKWLDIPALNHEKNGVSMKKDMYINLVLVASIDVPSDCLGGTKLNEWLTSLNYANDTVELVHTGTSAVVKNVYLLKDCTKDGAIVTVCSGCGASETNFVYATNTEHKYTAEWVDDVTATGTQTCYVSSTQKKTCTVPGCGEKITQTKADGKASGHYTTKGITNGEKFFFEYDCTKINEYKDYSCVVCGTKYTDLLTVGVSGLTGDAQKATIQAVKHDIIEMKQDATCTEDGYIVKECKNCEWIDAEKTPYGLADTKNEIIPNLGGHNKNHAKTIVLENTAPTLEQNGRFVYICGVCGETITETIAASLAIDSVIAPEYKLYSSGNVVNAIVSVTADEFVFNTLTIEVDSNLKLVEVEMLAKLDVNVSAFIDAMGNVVVFAEDTLAGDIQNATFAGGENVAFIMLTFATGKFTTGDFYMSTKITKGEIYNAEAETEAEKFETMEPVDVAEDEKAMITVANPGNFNGDKSIDARDLASFLPALANAVLMGTVENKYDLNNDGNVDFDDVAGLRAYIADGQSLKSYLAMIGEDVDAALAANSAPSITGVATDDKVLFDAAMKAVIESGKFTTEDYIALCINLEVETLEDVVSSIIKIAIQEAINEPNEANRDVRFTVDTVYIRVLKDGVFEIVEISY